MCAKSKCLGVKSAGVCAWQGHMSMCDEQASGRDGSRWVNGLEITYSQIQKFISTGKVYSGTYDTCGNQYYKYAHDMRIVPNHPMSCLKFINDLRSQLCNTKSNLRWLKIATINWRNLTTENAERIHVKGEKYVFSIVCTARIFHMLMAHVVTYWPNLMQFDWGWSLWTEGGVWSLVLMRFKASLQFLNILFFAYHPFSPFRHEECMRIFQPACEETLSYRIQFLLFS